MPANNRTNVLGGKKRSVEEVNKKVPDQESPVKNSHAEKPSSIEPERRKAEARALSTDASAASRLINNNCAIICVNAASVSGPGVVAIVESTKAAKLV